MAIKRLGAFFGFLAVILVCATFAPRPVWSLAIQATNNWPECEPGKGNSIADGSSADPNSGSPDAAGDPYDISTHSIYRGDFDFAINAGNGVTLGISRNYSLLDFNTLTAASKTTFGPYWICNYNEFIFEINPSGGGTYYDYHDESGKVYDMGAISSGIANSNDLQHQTQVRMIEVEDNDATYDSGTSGTGDVIGYQIIREDDGNRFFDLEGRLIYQGRNPYNSLDGDGEAILESILGGPSYTFYEGVVITYLSNNPADDKYWNIDKVTAPNGKYLKFYYDKRVGAPVPNQTNGIDYYDGTSLKDVYFYYYDSNGMLSFTKENSSTNTAGLQYEYGSWDGTGPLDTSSPYNYALGMVTRWRSGPSSDPLVAYEYDGSGGDPDKEWRYDLNTSTWNKRLTYPNGAGSPRVLIYHYPDSGGTVDVKTNVSLYSPITGRKAVDTITYTDLPADVEVARTNYTHFNPTGRFAVEDQQFSDGTNYKTKTTYNYIGTPVNDFYSYQLTSIDQYRDSSNYYTTSFTYDTIFGHKFKTITDPASNVTTFEYYNNTYDPSDGHLWGFLKSVTDADNLTTEFSYDSQGRLTDIDYPDSTSVSISYDSNGFVDTYTNRLGHETEFTYNSWGQVKTVENYLGQTITYRYTIIGDGTPPVTHNPPWLYKTELPGSRSVSYGHNDWGQVTTVTDALSNVTTMAYDGQGRRTSITNDLSETRTYVYNDLDQLIRFEDGESNETVYTYDPFGRLWVVADDDGEETTITYTGEYTCGCNGSSRNLIQGVEDPLGNSVLYGYNFQGMLTSMHWNDGSATYTWLDNIQYDDLGNLTQVRDNRLKYGSYNIGDQTFHYEYDTQGRMTAEIWPTGRRVEYTYDSSLKRLSTAKGPWGHVSKIAYDGYSRVDSITDATGGVMDYIYYPSGDDRLKEIEMPNGMSSLITYDSLERVDTIEHFNSSAASLEKFEFTYNNGDLITRVDNNGGNYSTYTYDDAYRLTNEYKPGSNYRDIDYDFTGDDAGNRVERTANYGGSDIVTAYTHNNLNQVTSETTSGTTINYYYDEAGNLTEKKIGMSTIWSATYRPGDDRMVSVTTGGKTTEYVYDYMGRRLLRVDDDDTRTFYYYSGLSVIAEEEIESADAALMADTVVIADDEEYGSPNSNGWWIVTGTSGTLQYSTDSQRGKVLDWTRTSGSYLAIGDRYTSQNPYDTAWNSAGSNLSFWSKNGNTASTFGVIVFCRTELNVTGDTQMQYWFHSGTNTADTVNNKGVIRLGNDWYQNGDWQHFQRDVEADFQSLFPGEDFYEINGIWFSGPRLYIDDITVSPAARTMVRHGGAEWTPGAENWPSGGLDHDTAIYHYYDHLGNLKGRTGADGLALGSQWHHDAFGQVISGTANDYEHTGNHYDGDAGLFYFNNRWYDPNLGRFTQRNTPFQPLLEHSYAISESNPINAIDPTGFSPCETLCEKICADVKKQLNVMSINLSDNFLDICQGDCENNIMGKWENKTTINREGKKVDLISYLNDEYAKRGENCVDLTCKLNDNLQKDKSRIFIEKNENGNGDPTNVGDWGDTRKESSHVFTSLGDLGGYLVVLERNGRSGAEYNRGGLGVTVLLDKNTYPNYVHKSGKPAGGDPITWHAQ